MAIPTSEKKQPDEPLFNNPFQVEDLAVFDDRTLREMLDSGGLSKQLRSLARSLHGANATLVEHISRNLPRRKARTFHRELARPLPESDITEARRRVLDDLFWELTYWKTPELYEELTEGELLHPGIFKNLAPDLKGKVVLDAGAGSGRASFECLSHGASKVYAVEPSPGLLRLLEEKIERQPEPRRLVALRGRFDNLPLEDNSVDLALSCSAFTAEPGQGGEEGLVEFKRVTKPGGKIVIIWPRQEDREWLEQRGFHRVEMPLRREMNVRFRSLQSAVRCARRFYYRNRQLLRYLLTRRKPEVPFSILGFNPPRDYCWLWVEK